MPLEPWWIIASALYVSILHNVLKLHKLVYSSLGPSVLTIKDSLSMSKHGRWHFILVLLRFFNQAFIPSNIPERNFNQTKCDLGPSKYQIPRKY